ncbi:MAG: tetratricopeptide repeat protein [Bryobacteraceae bacterium]|nr:tetratricopeptide repeat protein [Bryobacteraceae bacterium]
MMLTLLVLLWTVSPGQADYEKANRLFTAKQFEAAFTAVDESLRRDPNLVPALTLKAKLAMAVNRFDVARQCLEHALTVDPKAPYAQFLYGLEAYLTNDLKEALPRFRKARELAPKDARAALYLGLTTESTGRADEAMRLYREAVQLEAVPQSDTWLPGARLLLLLGQLEECGTWLRRAVQLAPRSRDAHFELARLLLKQGDAGQSAGEGELALTLPGGATSDATVHYLLIRAWKQAGQSDRAAAHAAVMRAQESAR